MSRITTILLILTVLLTTTATAASEKALKKKRLKIRAEFTNIAREVRISLNTITWDEPPEAVYDKTKDVNKQIDKLIKLIEKTEKTEETVKNPFVITNLMTMPLVRSNASRYMRNAENLYVINLFDESFNFLRMTQTLLRKPAEGVISLDELNRIREMAERAAAEDAEKATPPPPKPPARPDALEPWIYNSLLGGLVRIRIPVHYHEASTGFLEAVSFVYSELTYDLEFSINEENFKALKYAIEKYMIRRKKAGEGWNVMHHPLGRFKVRISADRGHSVAGHVELTMESRDSSQRFFVMNFQTDEGLPEEQPYRPVSLYFSYDDTVTISDMFTGK